jgi:Kef-type K+ transport system membrane component KefB
MESELITLGVLFFFAILGGIIAKRVKQPTVLGLLLVGAVIGPNALGIVDNHHWIELIIEIGAVLLLFVVGLEFDLPKLMKLGFKAFAIATLKVGIAFFLGFQVALLLGLGSGVAIFCGAILSFSSTVVIVKILEQKSLYNRKETPLLLTVLIFEDILAVMALIFFSSMKASGGANIISIVEHVVIALTTLIIAYLVMLRIAKYIFTWLTRNSSEDITTFLALGFCAGFSALAYTLGLSPSAGAFVAGSIIASMPQAKNFEHAISPYVLIFSSLFFIAMGTLVNFGSILPNIVLIVVLIIAVIISRFVAIGLVSYVFAGFRGDQAFFSSLAMLSVGEFALLVAKESVGFGLGVDIVTVTSVLIFVSAIMMSVLIARSKKIHRSWEATKRPQYISHSVQQLAGYVRSFFDQIDTENRSTRRFKTSLVSSLFALLVAVYIIVGWNKVVGILTNFGLHVWIIYFVHVVMVCVTAVALYVCYKRVDHTQETLIRVLTNIDRMMNHKKSRRLLKNLSVAMVFFLAALFFPIIIFAMALPVWTTIVSFVLLAVSATYLRAALRVLGSYQSDAHTSGRLYNSITLKELYRAKNPISSLRSEQIFNKRNVRL